MKFFYYLLIYPIIIALIILVLLTFKNPISTQTEDLKNYFVGPTNVTPTKSVAPKPTPIALLPDDGRKGTYQIGQGEHTGPSVAQVIFDPLDVKKGDVLTVSIKESNTYPIKNVTAVLSEDNSTQNIEFKLESGSNQGGIWVGQIKLADSVLYKYILQITSTSENGISKVIVAPRS